MLLISTYEMGRQPFGLASPAAWLREAGAQVRCLDLSVEPFSDDAVSAADLIAFYVPMHTATRMAASALERTRAVNPGAHVCFFGLYAAQNAPYLRSLGVDTVLGGEFEAGLVNLASRLSNQRNGAVATGQTEPLISLERQTFLVPDRSYLPALENYAHLVMPSGEHRAVGYVEASRGCKHLCRHCPIPPVYGGRFRVVQRDVVLDDIRQQVAAGARHFTFGDPDFFNGIGHAIPLVRALHAEHPQLTYDVTIKVEHLLKHREFLETLAATGCLFVTSAVESFDERVLAIFEKHHTREDFEVVLRLCREVGLLLIPTFVAFTPWITLEGYRSFLAEIARLELVGQVAPIQYAIRLLIPPGSRLLELDEVRRMVGEVNPSSFAFRWRSADPRVDELQQDVERLVKDTSHEPISRDELFARVWDRSHADNGALGTAAPSAALPARASPVPQLTEPWFC